MNTYTLSSISIYLFSSLKNLIDVKLVDTLESAVNGNPFDSVFFK